MEKLLIERVGDDLAKLLHVVPGHVEILMRIDVRRHFGSQRLQLVAFPGTEKGNIARCLHIVCLADPIDIAAAQHKRDLKEIMGMKGT